MFRSGQRAVTQAIQKYLGSSYDAVKTVYDNLTPLLGLQTLADNVDKVVDVVDNLDDVVSVADNITDVSAVADNIVAVTEVNDKVDDFNTKYLGSYASAPTVDGNGDPLVEGATYWDTTLNTMFAYTGSQWVKPTGTGIVDVDTFTGDGSTASFPLDVSPESKTNTSVFIDGVYQEKDTYSVSANLITFNTAPNDEASIEVIVNEITNFVTGTQAETHTLTSGQTVVNLTNSPAFASFHIQGEDVDSHRLDLGTDYTLDLLTNTITLTSSYPENTVLKMLYGYDDDISVELAPLNQAILDHVNDTIDAHDISAIGGAADKFALSGNIVFESVSKMAAGELSDGTVLDLSIVQKLRDNKVNVRTRGFYENSDVGNATYKVLTTTEKNASIFSGYEGTACFQFNSEAYWFCIVFDKELNPLQLGARGDWNVNQLGSETDDYLPLQAAFDLASKVMLTAKHYTSQSLLIKQYQHIEGYRLGGTDTTQYGGSIHSDVADAVIKGTSTTVKHGFRLINVFVHNYTSDEGDNGKCVEALLFKGYIRGCRFTNRRGYGVRLLAGDDFSKTCTGTEIRENYFSSCKYALTAQSGVRRNTDPWVIDNDFWGNDYMILGIDWEDGSGGVFRGNHFYGMKYFESGNTIYSCMMKVVGVYNTSITEQYFEDTANPRLHIVAGVPSSCTISNNKFWGGNSESDSVDVPNGSVVPPTLIRYERQSQAATVLSIHNNIFMNGRNGLEVIRTYTDGSNEGDDKNIIKMNGNVYNGHYRLGRRTRRFVELDSEFRELRYTDRNPFIGDRLTNILTYNDAVDAYPSLPSDSSLKGKVLTIKNDATTCTQYVQTHGGYFLDGNFDSGSFELKPTESCTVEYKDSSIVTLTPSVANSALYSLQVSGVTSYDSGLVPYETISYTSDGTATITEIVDGLVNSFVANASSDLQNRIRFRNVNDTLVVEALVDFAVIINSTTISSNLNWASRVDDSGYHFNYINKIEDTSGGVPASYVDATHSTLVALNWSPSTTIPALGEVRSTINLGSGDLTDQNEIINCYVKGLPAGVSASVYYDQTTDNKWKVKLVNVTASPIVATSSTAIVTRFNIVTS